MSRGPYPYTAHKSAERKNAMIEHTKLELPELPPAHGYIDRYYGDDERAEWTSGELPSWLSKSETCSVVYTADQMNAYARAAQVLALERAALECEKLFIGFHSPYGYEGDCAAAIRSLKEKM